MIQEVGQNHTPLQTPLDGTTKAKLDYERSS